jgi:membrane protease YdiL (CAAX protease family)
MTVKQVFIAPDRRLRATWRAVLFVFTYLLLMLGGMVALGLAAGGWVEEIGFEGQVFLGGVFSLMSAGISSLLFIPWLDHRPLETLGLWFYDGWGRELLVGLGSGVAMISALAALLVASGGVALEPTGIGLEAALSWVGITGAIFVVGAVNEELMFRGYPFQRLVEGWGPIGAVTLLSGLFGLMHLGNPDPTALSTVNTMLAGVLLAVAYLRTRGLWLPIGLHFAWNFWMGPVLGFPVSGLELPGGILKAQAGEPAWLTGGSYGPEGSIVTTVVVVAATLWLARTKRLGVSPAMRKELE